MKYLSLLFFTLFTYIELDAQIVNCGNTSITISDVVCLDGGNDDPSDDFLKFTVTGSNIESDHIEQLPMNTTIDDQTNNHSFNPVSGNLSLYGDGPFCITSESEGCTPLVLLVDIYDGDTNMDCEEFRTVGIAGIPTLGQWGIMVLGLILTVFGILKIKNRILIPQPIKRT